MHFFVNSPFVNKFISNYSIWCIPRHLLTVNALILISLRIRPVISYAVLHAQYCLASAIASLSSSSSILSYLHSGFLVFLKYTSLFPCVEWFSPSYSLGNSTTFAKSLLKSHLLMGFLLILYLIYYIGYLLFILLLVFFSNVFLIWTFVTIF